MILGSSKLNELMTPQTNSQSSNSNPQPFLTKQNKVFIILFLVLVVIQSTMFVIIVGPFDIHELEWHQELEKDVEFSSVKSREGMLHLFHEDNYDLPIDMNYKTAG